MQQAKKGPFDSWWFLFKYFEGPQDIFWPQGTGKFQKIDMFLVTFFKIFYRSVFSVQPNFARLRCRERQQVSIWLYLHLVDKRVLHSICRNFDLRPQYREKCRVYRKRRFLVCRLMNHRMSHNMGVRLQAVSRQLQEVHFSKFNRNRTITLRVDIMYKMFGIIYLHI